LRGGNAAPSVEDDIFNKVLFSNLRFEAKVKRAERLKRLE